MQETILISNISDHIKAKVYRPDALANLLGVSLTTIHDWINYGRAIKGSGERVYLEKDRTPDLCIVITREAIIRFYEKLREVA